jgi:hypothetical protein
MSILLFRGDVLCKHFDTMLGLELTNKARIPVMNLYNRGKTPAMTLTKAHLLFQDLCSIA